MNYDFDEIIDRTSTNSEKWDKYKNTDILPMWVADMDFKAPPPVLKSLQERIEHGILGYTGIPDRLDDIIIRRMKSLYAWKIEKDWLLWIPGVVCGLNVASRTWGRLDQKIVTTAPVYPPFFSAPDNCGKKLATVPMMDLHHRFTLDFASLEKEFKDNAGLFLFCSPHNPCGTIFTRDELHELVRLCADNHVLICSDEVHSDFVLAEGKGHIPIASVSKTAADLTITLMAPSKTYNIPGLGCSFAIIPNSQLRQAYKKTLKGLIPEVNLFGLFAAKAAYEECDEWLSQLIAYLRKNSALVLQRVNQMKGLKLYAIESTYLAWIDVRGTGLEDPVHYFEQAGVGLSDGEQFGQKGFIRLNFGCPTTVLEKGLDRMEKALEKI